MCVAAIAWQADPRWRMVAIANRDERHARPSLPVHRWTDHGVIAGRDQMVGGTWLGVTEEGRFAVITNVPSGAPPKPDAPSRGMLTLEALTSEPDALFVDKEELRRYNPFNLIALSSSGLAFVTNFPGPERRDLAPGVHAVTNGPFEPVPARSRAAANALKEWLAADEQRSATLFENLQDKATLAGEAGLFVLDPVYGTRSSTVVLIDKSGEGTISELRYNPAARIEGTSEVRFSWPSVATMTA